MKTTLLTTVAFITLTGVAMAQAQHQQHHSGGTPASQAQAQPQSPAPTQPHGQMPMMGQMMQNMPEQCRAMLQNMPQGCMGMMQMMQHQGMQPSPSQSSAQSEATKAYLAAMDKMHTPMMQGARDPDPDVAFVTGMIPHHQGAIDMAKIVQQYGKDEQVKKWATDVIREQEREIGEMQAWLKAKGRM